VSFPGGFIFDDVMEALSECSLKYPVRLYILNALIDSLQNCGWDEEVATLEKYADDRVVVGAFRFNGIKKDS
jgi:hypothetical protein